jgi:PAS domain S-box-containing protein
MPLKGAASDRLNQSRERILQEWETEVRREELPGGPLDRPALRNTLPLVLDEMVKTLADPHPERAISRVEARLAKGHGMERANLPEYSLDRVIREYHVLRKVIFRVLEGEGEELPRRERDLIWTVITTSIHRAAIQFTRIRDQQKEKSKQDLNERNIELHETLEEHELEAALKGQMLRTIFERVQDYAIFTLDCDGYITSWAEGARKMKQYTLNEVIGRHFEMLYPEEGRRRNEPMDHLKVARIEGKYRGEGLRRRKDGALFLADVHITPMYEGSALAGYFKVVTDLTERNRVIQERDVSRSHAETLELENELRERFVFTLSHDLMNPLSAARVACELASKEPCSSERHHDLALRSIQSIERVHRMISNLLDASRVKAGQPFLLEFEEFDLSRHLEGVLAELGSVHGDRFRLQSSGPLQGFWDRQALTRVIENLATNAVKYGDPLKPITVRLESVEDRAFIKVHNFGSSINWADQESLFELFHRSPSAQTGQKKGWGIGLVLVRGITEAHRGIVTVQSFPKEGTTFFLDLPRDARPVHGDHDRHGGQVSAA